MESALHKVQLQPMKPTLGQKFMKRDVEKLLKQYLEEKLSDKTYNYEESLNWSKELSGDIQQAVRNLGYQRYKIIVSVSIIEACQQGIRLASRCIWDPETDNFAEFTYSSESMHATALVFGLYWE
jgi:hypothetical protein